ncbi:hypothetical protein PDJAM_G00091290 [Pangasius djambal]|uniref:Uncharacterized protein n=1 Tax=Pangasius djambal TaxID=1691987 RepID=A0ACC5Z517_9TELE|nr:hypothetical protein [Pangasius djambal]
MSVALFLYILWIFFFHFSFSYLFIMNIGIFNLQHEIDFFLFFFLICGRIPCVLSSVCISVNVSFLTLNKKHTVL